MDVTSVTGFLKNKVESWSPPHAFAQTSIAQLWSLATTVISLIDGIAVFFSVLYESIPRFVDRMVEAFNFCRDFIRGLLSTAQGFDDQIGSVVQQINDGQPSVEGGAYLWDLVKYILNLDALSDAINFIVGIGWFWLFIVLFVLGVATVLLVSGSVVYVTRRVVVFISAGFINVS